MKKLMQILNTLSESILWPIWYLFILGINILCGFYPKFSLFNCIMSVIMIAAILINPREFFKPFKRIPLEKEVEEIIKKIKSSNLSWYNKYKSIKGLKRINRTKEACFHSNEDEADLLGLFCWRETKEGSRFWCKISEAIEK